MAKEDGRERMHTQSKGCVLRFGVYLFSYPHLLMVSQRLDFHSVAELQGLATNP